MKPYPEQIYAARLAKCKGRGTVAMPTGTGKTITMALLINELQVKTLVIVPSVEIKRQLKECFLRYFGNLDNITIENIASAALQRQVDYDCLIIDEAHHVAAKTYRDLNKKYWGGIYYRFFFTATPFRHREEEQLLYESVAGPVIYRLEYKTAVENNYIVPIEPYFIPLPTSKTEGFNYSEVYSELIIENEGRNEYICELMRNLHANGKSTLVLVTQIRHGELLRDRMLELGLDIPFANGQDDESNLMIADFNSCKIPVLIGSSILGEGVDTKPCEYVVLAGGTGKSRGALMQACGRAVRSYPGKESAKIISFYESSHKWFKKHHAFFVKTMREEYGITPSKIGD